MALLVSSKNAEVEGYALTDPADSLCESADENLVKKIHRSRGKRVVAFACLMIAGIMGVVSIVRRERASRPSLAAMDDPGAELQEEEFVASMDPHTWEPRFLSAYPLAVCNDGSPAAYYFRQGDPKKKMWMVWLEGAGWCWDTISCSRPWHQGLGTSKSFPRSPRRVRAWTRSMQGIFDPVKDPLKGIHIVYVRTCGNDAFMGNRGPLPGTHAPGLSWHLRGEAIIEAVFADLRKRSDLGQSPEQRVLFGGCSSGARGAMMALDHVAAHLVGQASVMGILDSGVWLPLEPYRKELVSFDDQTSNFTQLANATGFIDDGCRETYSRDLWKCLRGSSRLPFVKTPYFITQSQYDLFAISVNFFGRYAPFVGVGPAQKEYAETYRNQLVEYLPVPPINSGQTIFSTACYTHCTLTSHTFYKIKSDGIVLATLFARWLETASPNDATGYLVDRCKGFNCCPHGKAAQQQEKKKKTTSTTTQEPPHGNNEWFHVPGWSWDR